MRIHILVFLLAAAAVADTVVLKNGLRVKGEVEKRGDTVVVRLAGKTWTFGSDQVREIQAGATLQEEYAAKAYALAADDAAGWYKLGLWAKEKHLAKAQAAFERVLEIDTDHRAARRALGFERVDAEWLSPAAAKQKKGFVLAGGRWMLPEEADQLLRKGLMEPAKVTNEHRRRAEEIVTALRDDDAEVRAAAKAMMDEVPPAALVRPLKKLLYARHAATRKLAVKQLGHYGDRVALPWLIRSSMYDASPAVRDVAFRSVKGFQDPDIFYPYARALFSRNPRISINASRILAELGDLRGVDVIIRRVSIAMGASGRANIFTGTQNSYIQDFDVEIAQAAAIGDPIIQTIRDGVILDYKIMGGTGERWIVERRAAYADALSSLTGRDFGEDFKAYARYARENDYPRAK